ncbi:uncharacterized protein J3R85_012690 [Psidium guajava]|nr:uncharacterized protein J3R85_012690 [Psidium guajava]
MAFHPGKKKNRCPECSSPSRILRRGQKRRSAYQSLTCGVETPDLSSSQKGQSKAKKSPANFPGKYFRADSNEVAILYLASGPEKLFGTADAEPKRWRNRMSLHNIPHPVSLRSGKLEEAELGERERESGTRKNF